MRSPCCPSTSGSACRTRFGRRMARNISTLLIEESHVAAVADPTAGAYAVEMLTHRVRRRRLGSGSRPSSGPAGCWARWPTGRCPPAWASDRGPAPRPDRHPAPAASPGSASSRTRPKPCRPGPLARRHADGIRWAADFEAMRDEPAADVVFLATLGPVAEHSARAGFVTNLLAAGGIRRQPAGRTETVQDVVAAYQGERVVVVAGTDTAYADLGCGRDHARCGPPAPGRSSLAGKPVPAGGRPRRRPRRGGPGRGRLPAPVRARWPERWLPT